MSVMRYCFLFLPLWLLFLHFINFINYQKRSDMAKAKVFTLSTSHSKKRKGVHSKNASKGQNAYKKKYRGGGK